MFYNYLKVAFRNLARYKGYSLINIAGLAIGIAGCLLISLWVRDELSYDRYHSSSDRIYRVIIDRSANEIEGRMASTSPLLAGKLALDFPEVLAATRIHESGFPVFQYGDRIFSEEGGLTVDHSFFQIFDGIQFIAGDPATALTKPNTLVLTESLAKKYFDDMDPVGKTIVMDRSESYEVVAIVRDMPANSHLHFDFLDPAVGTRLDRITSWTSMIPRTYVLLDQGADAAQLEAKLATIVQQHVMPRLEQITGVTLEQFQASGQYYNFKLQPLESIHLYSNIEDEFERNGSITMVYMFAAIALIILLLACVNFVNLSTARSAGRAKEVGLRKVVGSTNRQVKAQFLTESILLSGFAVLLAALLVELLLPTYNQLSGKSLEMSLLFRWFLIPGLATLAVAVGLAAGAYPAFMMARFQPAKVLKGNFLLGGARSSVRNILVVFQFAVSVALIVGAITVSRQMDYIQTQNLGFDGDQVLVVRKTDDIGESIRAFKDRVAQLPGVKNTSCSSALIGSDFPIYSMYASGPSGPEPHTIYNYRVDEDFLATYGLKLKQGRFFQKTKGTDAFAVVINETTAQALSVDDPLSAIFTYPNDSQEYHVVGVVEDFHFHTLHQTIKPLVLVPYTGEYMGRNMSIRFDTPDVPGLIGRVEEIWHEYAGQQQFEYAFFDQTYDSRYRTEMRTGQIFGLFSSLAILIACLGLFGLTAYIAEKRSKEIGIRKILGASVINIVSIMSGDFFKLVLIGGVIATPIAWYVFNGWLENFAYRIDLGITTFVMAGGLVLLIALLTVSYQAIKAATSNPVDAIRYE
ncbi:MAG: ABC transporter permease [Candidatus Neomarinimicrobiota bacterium]